jgi:hypothetical protein
MVVYPLGTAVSNSPCQSISADNAYETHVYIPPRLLHQQRTAQYKRTHLADNHHQGLCSLDNSSRTRVYRSHNRHLHPHHRRPSRQEGRDWWMIWSSGGSCEARTRCPISTMPRRYRIIVLLSFGDRDDLSPAERNLESSRCDQTILARRERVVC